MARRKFDAAIHTRNKAGKLVSKAKSAKAKANPWAAAVRAARTRLGVKGFVPLKKDGALYKVARELYGGSLPKSSKRVKNDVGDLKIVRIEVVRAPVSKLLTGALSAFSFGKFGKRTAKHYDELFHLGICVTLETGRKYVLEKNARINIGPFVSRQKMEYREIGFNSDTAVNKLLANTKRSMGAKYQPYDAVTNNCQDFVLAVLKSNGLGSVADYAWIKQDVQKLFKKLPYLQGLAKGVTDLAAGVDKMMGNGRFKKSKLSAAMGK